MNEILVSQFVSCLSLHFTRATTTKKTDIDDNNIPKILFYAPGNDDGLQRMTSILQELKLNIDSDDDSCHGDDGWILLPLLPKTSYVENNLQSSDLGGLLQYALERARQYTDDGNVVFLGMDSPMLPLQDIITSIAQKQAMLCPADDGGYGMLSVPFQVSSSLVFRNIIWSHSLTGMSQLKALTDMNIGVKIGILMYDIDEPDDVHKLCRRIQQQMETNNMVLYSCSRTTSTSSITSTHPECFYTRKALIESGLFEATAASATQKEDE